VREECDNLLRPRRLLIEQALQTVLRPVRGCPDTLTEAMRYSLLAPGKRLRPLLVMLACEACGGKQEQALPGGCAVEMIHTYSLIHDDLPAMDNDDMRRGLPTCHKQFGEALAILAGDGLLTQAFAVLATGYPAATAAACCRELAVGAGTAGMVGGQVDDLAWERHPEQAGRTLADLEHLHARKTGALIRASLRMGVYAATVEPSDDLLRRFSEFGHSLGLAFQIVDDLLDVEGDPSALGKNTNKDAGRGKLTYPGLLGVAESRRLAERLTNDALAQLSPLGLAAQPLVLLTRWMLDRDR